MDVVSANCEDMISGRTTVFSSNFLSPAWRQALDVTTPKTQTVVESKSKVFPR